MEAYKIVIFAIAGIYMVLNFKHAIQMLQQNSYRIDRYWRYQRDHLADAWVLVDVALLFLLYSTLLNTAATSLIVGMAAITKIFLILRRKFKKPLVFTKRVWRIYITTCVIPVSGYMALIIMGFKGCFSGMWYSGSDDVLIPLGVLLLVTMFSWMWVILAVWLLKPVEAAINRKYYNEAAAILRSKPEMKIIGITGSFGKTSTKHYLHRILSEEFDTLMTPGSYNTPMGVIRTVRELMRPNHSIFICEMGAKQLGDIKEICDLVHPQIGIITAVGAMHLESFKTLENVQRTKFELADALPSDGLAVINNDFELCANRKVDNCPSMRYAISNPEAADLRAEDIVYTPEGTAFTAVWADGHRLPLETRLVGESNISNLLAAVAVAHYLGMADDKIRYAVSRIEQVEHRLSIKQTPGGVTILDDAFNSNPVGSRMAVDVLAHFKDSGKRIIVTPGMIELGDKQYELNRALGKHIGESVDVAVIVGEYNRGALLDGLKEAEFPESQLHVVDSFAESQKLLSTMLQRGDTVLYENDLPDTFK